MGDSPFTLKAICGAMIIYALDIFLEGNNIRGVQTSKYCALTMYPHSAGHFMFNIFYPHNNPLNTLTLNFIDQGHWVLVSYLICTLSQVMALSFDPRSIFPIVHAIKLQLLKVDELSQLKHTEVYKTIPSSVPFGKEKRSILIRISAA